MKLPFVSRERYDEKCAELHALQAKYDALMAERAKPKVTKPAPTPHDQMIDRMASDFEQTIPDKAAARAEAERIRREMFG